jgi:NAD(P)-dependent dehydrogenase (short-subunit alcohol dehydrogenase family)
MYGLKGKVALVTGGASGIGQATAQLFASHGAKVVVSDLDEVNGEATVNAIRQQGGEAVFLKTDVSDPAACEALVAAAVKTFGSLDIAFNNAGIGGESNPVGEMSIDGWKKIIAVNLDSVFYCMKYEIQQMLKQGKGAIVNMSSILGQVGFANSAGYVAAKHGVVGLTQNAAVEYSSKGIRVNAVGPGFIDTPLLTHAGLDSATRQYLASQHAIGRMGTSGEVAELVIWLSSDKAGFVTGSYYAVDGGYLAR